jgi:hypothetical protein
VPATIATLVDPIVAQQLLGDEFDRYLRRNPVLLRPSLRKLLTDEFSTGALQRPTKWQQDAELILERIDALRLSYEAHERSFRLEGGPVEQLWAGLENEAISPEDSLLVAWRPEVSRSLAPVYVRALSNVTLHECHQGRWRRAQRLHRVLMAAVQTIEEPSERQENKNVVECDWVEIAVYVLATVPDARILREATTAGERVAARTAVKDPGKWHALAIHRLGVLYLDSYVRERKPHTFHVDEVEWRNNFVREYGAEASTVPVDEWQMPPIEEALRTAEGYFRQAIALRCGYERALSQKALAQTLVWLLLLGEQVSKDEIETLCREAIASLTDDPQHQVSLFDNLRIIGRSDFKEFPVLDFGVQKTSLDPIALIEVLLLSSGVLPFLPLNVFDDYITTLRDAKMVFEQYGTEDQQHSRRRTLAATLPYIFARKEWGQLKGTCETMAQQLASLQLHGRQFAACCVGLSLRAAIADQEILGLQMLHMAQEEDPSLKADYADVIAQLSADLLFNLGAERFNKKIYSESIDAYSTAFGNYLWLRLIEKSRSVLKRIRDLSEDGGDVVIARLLVTLATCGIGYELRGGDDAAQQLEELSQKLVKSIFARGKESGSQINLFYQVTKGLQFGQACFERRARTPAEESELQAYLGEIRTLEAGLIRPTAGPADEDAVLEKEMYLLSYARDTEMLPGIDPLTTLANLQHKFERRARTLISPEEIRIASILGLDTLQECLGDSTVVFNFYLGVGTGRLPSGHEELALYTFAATKDDFGLARVAHDLTAVAAAVTYKRHRLVCSPIAMGVCATRQAIQSEPGFSVASPEATEQLEAWMPLLAPLHDLKNMLAALGAENKTHLCIVPHGPLHYFPFHLIGPPDRPLVDDWSITYLPNLSLLKRTRRVGTEKPSVTMTSIGKSFVSLNPRALPKMADSAIEAEEIAAIFDLPAVTEDFATPKTVMEALVQSWYVHISTHGEQNTAAPAFQCLYLSPGENGEDRLFAYQIGDLDLTRTEVVTLSACETGLGRFDYRDNLRGLPASFFQAGVSTVVATLWQTEVKVCRAFFSEFYRNLAKGSSKLHAFTNAQALARTSFPAYRDWGSFYFLGDWN